MHTTALTPVDVSAIKATAKPYTTALVKRDWDALTKLFADDVVILPPDEPFVTSAKVRSWLEKFPNVKQFDFEFDHIEGHEPLAVAYGHFSMTVERNGAPIAVRGKFVDTFRRDDNGRWRFATMIWNSDQPAPGAQEATGPRRTS